VATSARLRTPTAIGYFHPRIVVPRDFRARVSGEEWRAIIAHENAHLRRYDDWSKAVQAVLARMLWFLPALWLLGARLDLERELASDELVVASTMLPHAYAACLVRLVVDGNARRLPTPAAWRSRTQVAVRVERMLRPRAAGSALAAGFRLGCLALAVTGSGLLTAFLAPPATAPAASAVPPTRGSLVLRSLVPRTKHNRIAYAHAPAGVLAPPRQVSRHRPSRPLSRDFSLLAVAGTHERCRTCAYLHSPALARLDGLEIFGPLTAATLPDKPLARVPRMRLAAAWDPEDIADGDVLTGFSPGVKTRRPSWGGLLY
jgi:hypothetical protein